VVQLKLKCDHENLCWELKHSTTQFFVLINSSKQYLTRMFNQISWTPKLLLAALVGSLMFSAITGNHSKNIAILSSKANAVNQPRQQSGVSQLDRIKNRGYLICGVNGELPGFSFVNAEGKYAGIDVDFCRAIAAAIFDDANQVQFRDVTTEERFDVLKSGEIDLLSRNTTETLSRDTDGNLDFTPPIFYDAQGVLVNRDSKIQTLRELANKTICVPENTTSYDNLQDYLHQAQISAKILTSDDREALFDFYEQDRCQAITGDISQLIVRKTILANPQDHIILAQHISQEPLAPVLIHQDSQWFDIVKWVTFTLIQAEELNINSENINVYHKSKESEIRRFLGIDGTLGSDMGLTNDFTQRIIEQVGNYSEIYERNLGQPFGLERGKNALWKEGGLMYSPPFD
jgi:general L-amino acid transport system substrate-binding protein